MKLWRAICIHKQPNNLIQLDMLNLGIKLTDLGIIPESILRISIKKLIQQRLLEIPINAELVQITGSTSQKMRLIESLRKINNFYLSEDY